MFNNIYSGKKVVVTGHTGFKGSWLCEWLLSLGAEVFGYSIDVPTKPALFEVLQLDKRIHHNFGDVRDPNNLKAIIDQAKPDFIFHLAAQPIVSESYENPIDTFSTNVMGTANILECCRHINWPCAVIIVTSDKCYDNVEWIWGYRENDGMGGKDPYSGSKGAAELAFKSFYHSFFENHSHVKLCSVRAGNVIGGGDWAKNRIVADAVRAWSNGKDVEIRSEHATRPWQHVLEPLSGYLHLASLLHMSSEFSGESFNFGPSNDTTATVGQLLKKLSKHWQYADNQTAYHVNTPKETFHEAGLLRLNCDKALLNLSWRATLSFDDMSEMVTSWYRDYYDGKDMVQVTQNQIQQYLSHAEKQKISWVEK